MTRTVLVSGGNRGLGLEVVALLAQKGKATTILMGTRELKNGEEAIKTLEKRGLTTEQLKRIKTIQLDVTDKRSVQNLAKRIKEDHGSLQVLYNNSGIARSDAEPEAAKKTIEVNYTGAARLLDAVLPLIPTDGTGRVVMVGSSVGALNHYLTPEPLKGKLDNHQSLSRTALDGLVADYLYSEVPGNPGKENYAPGQAFGTYGVSKLFFNTLARVVANELKAKQIPVALICPGFCATDINGNAGVRKAITGAKGIVFGETISLAETGGFWMDYKPCEIYIAPQSQDVMTAMQIQSEKDLEAAEAAVGA